MSNTIQSVIAKFFLAPGPTKNSTGNLVIDDHGVLRSYGVPIARRHIMADGRTMAFARKDLSVLTQAKYKHLQALFTYYNKRRFGTPPLPPLVVRDSLLAFEGPTTDAELAADAAAALAKEVPVLPAAWALFSPEELGQSWYRVSNAMRSAVRLYNVVMNGHDDADNICVDGVYAAIHTGAPTFIPSFVAPVSDGRFVAILNLRDCPPRGLIFDSFDDALTLVRMSAI